MSAMKEKFYVLIDKRDLRFHEVSGDTTEDIMEAFRLENLETMRNYLKREIDEDAQDYLKIYEVNLSYYVDLVEGE